LETLHQYAWDRLIATDRLGDARDAHAAHYAMLAAEQAALMGAAGRQMRALDRLEVDYDNLRAALAYLIEDHRADDAVRMVRRLLGLFNIRHPREGLGWFSQVIAIADDLPAKTRSRLLGDTAWVAFNAGDLPTMTRDAQAALDVGGGDAPAVAHWMLANWHNLNRDFKLAVEQARQAIAMAAAASDRTVQVTVTGVLVDALAALGAESEARQAIAETIQLAEALDHPTITAAAYANCGVALALLACPQEAVALFERGLAHADAAGPAITIGLQVDYALEVEDPDRAASMLRVAIPIAKDQLRGSLQISCLLPVAKLMGQTEKPELACRFLGAYRRFAVGAAVSPNPLEARWYDRLVNQLTDTLGATAVDDELGRGAQLTVDQVMQLAFDAVDQTS